MKHRTLREINNHLAKQEDLPYHIREDVRNWVRPSRLSAKGLRTSA